MYIILYTYIYIYIYMSMYINMNYKYRGFKRTKESKDRIKSDGEWNRTWWWVSYVDEKFVEVK